MPTIRHKLKGIDPILYLLNDDGANEVTVVIHGAEFGLAHQQRPELEALRCSVSEAQIAGRVYLLSWKSGYWTPGGYHSIELSAHRLGCCLSTILGKIPRTSKFGGMNLIGHSLDGHVIVSALLQGEIKNFKIKDVVLLGAALGEEDFEGQSPRSLWRRCLGQIRGSIFHCYNRDDYPLFLRRLFRWEAEESMGRGRLSHIARRIKNISFSGRLPDDWQHSYLHSLDHVLKRVNPSRVRSNNYPVFASCNCPYCDADLIVTADVVEGCPDCGTAFEYKSSTSRCRWIIKPELVECPHCEGPKGILVQRTGIYRCPDCRKPNKLERAGRNIYAA